MAKISIKINGQTQERQLPDSITELSLLKFIKLDEAYSGRNSRQALSIWLDITPDELDCIKGESLDAISKLISWYDMEAVRYIISSPLPEIINYNGGTIEIPTAVNFEDSVTIGQFMAFDDLRAKYPAHIAALAAYLSPKMLSNGKYIDSLEKSYVLQASQIPAYLGFPIANFFLRCRAARLPISGGFNSLGIRTLRRLGWIALMSMAIGTLLMLWLILV